jgi:hypothetical protein
MSVKILLHGAWLLQIGSTALNRRQIVRKGKLRSEIAEAGPKK